MHPDAAPGPSAIAGHGLFATAPIAAGARVVGGGGPPAAEAVPANHSCDPNLGWSGPDLVALRDIAAGEELTHDYATSVTTDGFLLRCNCGSMRCRGLIEGDDWRIPQLRQRYRGRFAPDVQRRIDLDESGRS
jgi:hypothetical protein